MKLKIKNNYAAVLNQAPIDNLKKFLHVKFIEDFGVTLFTSEHLLWVHLPHSTRNTELAFECRFLVAEVDGSNPGNSMLFPCARYFICIASVDSAVK